MLTKDLVEIIAQTLWDSDEADDPHFGKNSKAVLSFDIAKESDKRRKDRWLTADTYRRAEALAKKMAEIYNVD